MLIQFAVTNYRSFREKAVFSMLATGDEQHANHVVTDGGHRVLRTAAIYGANAAGKSNLVRAINFARELVLKGTLGSD